MQFQAYPQQTGGRKDFRALLRLQGLLHSSDSVVLPCTLLFMSSGLVLYQHLSDPDTGRHSIRNFLTKILVSMLPLAVLERRILRCSDPVGMFSRFSVKVLLMHFSFLALRMVCLVVPQLEVGGKYTNLLGFMAASILLPWVFKLRPNLGSVCEHRDVVALAFLAFTIAVTEVLLVDRWSSIHYGRTILLEDIILTGSDYIEVLSFVPAMWMAYREDTAKACTELADVEDSQKKAVCLFAFLAAFYFSEDLLNAFSLWHNFPLAATGHLAHYLLLLDFATFLLAHLYDPEKFSKLRGTLLNWVVDTCAV